MPDPFRILLSAAFPLAAAWSLGRFLLHRRQLPAAIQFGVGAALLSGLVFILTLAGLASAWAFGLLGAALLAAGAQRWRLSIPRPPLLALLLAPYGLLYVVHALAPEIQPDAFAYHLGLVREWLRTGGFPARVGFFEMLPHGMEMLYAFAFAFGQHSAAKLVHLAFLLLTVPLIVSVADRLGLTPETGWLAAILYLATPVVGTSASSAYTDAALVFFALAAFYLFLRWRQDGDDRLLLAAGLLAGFCYATKMTGLIVPAAFGLFVLLARRWRAAAWFAAAAAVMVAPWMLRSLWMSGNPVAPLYNRFFPNPHFHIWAEEQLVRWMRTYEGVTAAGLPLELTLGGEKVHGLLGPAFLLAPLALLALRKPAGRWVLAAAAALALPWTWNAGARFLMPALPLVCLAMTMVLPRTPARALIAFHIVTCWPPVTDLYAGGQGWRLRGFPWRAALRLEAEPDYLRRRLFEYSVAELAGRHTKPGDRVLDLFGAPGAYLDVEALSPWQSAPAGRAADALEIAAAPAHGVLYDLRAHWPPRVLTAMRVRLARPPPGLWSIQEAHVLGPDKPVPPDALWRLDAWPNVWEAARAADRNPVSRWVTWEAAREGMYWEADFGRPHIVAGARLTCYGPERAARVQILGRVGRGAWRLLEADPTAQERPALNLRRSAARILRREGFRFVLTAVGNEGYAAVGRALVDNPGDWESEVLGNAGNVYLLALR